MQVGPDGLDIVEVTFGNGDDLFSVAAYTIQVAPSAPFAFPGEILVVFQPLDIIVRVQPCRIFVCKDILRGCAADLGDPYFVGILFPVQLLDEQLIAFGDEVHTRDIVVAGISGNVDPGRCSSCCRDVSDFYGRVGSSCFRIGEMKDSGIDGIDVVDDIEYAGSFRIALPVSDVFAVRTPAETVAATEFLFIYPVECTVYDGLASVAGQLGDFAGVYVFHIYIIVGNISHPCSVG